MRMGIDGRSQPTGLTNRVHHRLQHADRLLEQRSSESGVVVTDREVQSLQMCLQKHVRLSVCGESKNWLNPQSHPTLFRRGL